MSFELRHDYWDDPAARAAFKAFVLEIHGLDFGDWEAGGFWDSAYRPFSYFHEGALIANVCLYELEAWIEGRPARLGQFSAVGTRPNWRRRGLARELGERAMESAGDLQGLYLFADEAALPFYERCGFLACDEFLESAPLSPVARREGARQLDPRDPAQLSRILDLARRRSPVSDRFSVHSDKLLAFHLLYLLGDAVWEIPALDCVVLARRREGVLELFDLLAVEIPELPAFYPYLAEPGDQEVRFHFHADKMNLSRRRTLPLRAHHCFVKDGFPLSEPVFPYTSRA